MNEQVLYNIVDKAKKYDELIQLQRTKVLCCDFCGKSQNEIKKLIDGGGIYICNECVVICNEILEEEKVDTVANEQSDSSYIIK